MCDHKTKEVQIVGKVEEGKSRQHSSFHASGVNDAEASAKTSVNNRGRRVYWLNRLFGWPLKKDRSQSKTKKGPGHQQQSESSSDGPASTTAPPPEKKKKHTKKKRTLCGLFDCFRRRTNVVPSPEDEDPQEQPKNTDKILNKVDAIPQKVAKPKKAVTFKTDVQFIQSQTDIELQDLEDEQLYPLGFPNPIMTTCYMNACLQSLLTLTEFVSDVRRQEEVLSLIPGPGLILSHFINIERCRSSGDPQHKIQTLLSFKRALSVQAPEFEDLCVKDAHEFLTTILYQMRSLAPSLQEVATFAGNSYSCPVDTNLVFKMQNTRTCRRCGAQSNREEVFTDLSLDVIPRGSVEQMLQEYQKETDLDYNCECGSSSSAQKSTFLTLPRVLILHLKRFRFTECLQMEKVDDPILLLKELTVSSSQDECGSYRLVSVISHLGSQTHTGHYISDGLHVEDEQDSPGDRWLHYNDEMVTETTVDDVCQCSRRAAYILFYQRQVGFTFSGHPEGQVSSHGDFTGKSVWMR